MTGYPPSHPWYYLQGGTVFRPRTIKAYALITGYKGYRADEIAAADRLPEPKRSRKLAALKAEVLAGLKADMARYRHLACALRARRRTTSVAAQPVRSDDLDTAIGLVFSHLYNWYAHLVALEALGQDQLEMDF
ncbi:hypothetical protein [Rhizobium sp. PAMB 3182]